MTVEEFRNTLEKLVEGVFAVNVIDMEETRETGKKLGFDDTIYVAGEGEDEVFTLSVVKITPERVKEAGEKLNE